MSKRAVIYCRTAWTEEEGTQRIDPSLDAQRVRCVHYADLHGWEVVHTHYEIAPGTSASRPQLNELFTTAEDGEVDVVIVSDLDRLARDLTALLTIRERLASHGTELAVVNYPDRQRVDEMIDLMTKAR